MIKKNQYLKRAGLSLIFASASHFSNVQLEVQFVAKSAISLKMCTNQESCHYFLLNSNVRFYSFFLKNFGLSSILTSVVPLVTTAGPKKELGTGDAGE